MRVCVTVTEKFKIMVLFEPHRRMLEEIRLGELSVKDYDKA